MLVAAALLGGLALRAIYVAAGHFYLDAGFYLQATRAVLDGKLPYRDFFFVQGPVYPYLYAPFWSVLLPLVHSPTLATRLTSTLFGLGACFLAADVARRLSGRWAGIVTALLLLPNSYLAYDYAVEKLYAPTAFFLALGAWLATPPAGAASAGTARLALAGASLAVATGLRLTVLPTIAALGLYLLLTARGRGATRLLLPPAVQAACLAAIFAPFVLIAPDALAYHLFRIHESAGADSPYQFGAANKVMVVLALFRDNQLLGLLLVTAALGLALRLLPAGLAGLTAHAPLLLPWLLAGAVGSANFVANWVHASYQSVLVPVLAAAVGSTVVLLGREIPDARVRRAALAAVAVGALLQPVAYGRKELWSRGARPLSPYAPELVRLLRERAAPGEPVLVLNAAFAVEAARPLLRGSEGFPFTYTPLWPTDRAREAPSLNDELLIEAFRERRPAVVALVRNQFSVGFPGFVPRPEGSDALLWQELERNYERIAAVPNPDATDNDILVYVPRPS